MTREELEAKVNAEPFWYHKIELPHGITTPGWAPLDESAYRIPESMKGERVLDVGAWDGYWTFKALDRGASWVTAIDDFSDSLGLKEVDRATQWKTFNLCKEARGDKFCQPLSMSVYDIANLGVTFDRVFCFGVLYHLRHPLLALDKLRSVCTKSIHIESAILDNLYSPYTGERMNQNACHAEFYPRDEFGKNPTNWWVPTLRCLGAMLEAAGFKNVQTWKLTDAPEHLSQCRGFAYGEV